MLALHAWNSRAFQGCELWREGLVSASGFREGAHGRIASDSEEGRHLHHHSRDKANPGQEGYMEQSRIRHYLVSSATIELKSLWKGKTIP